MNRIDRLTGTILLLQGHRGLTAERIASHWEISVRTVYRDLAALGEAGVPILCDDHGGYRLVAGYHVPPVMFTEEEAAALFVSGAVTEQVADRSLAHALTAALLKIRSVLPQERCDYLRRFEQSFSVRLGPPRGAPSAEGLIPIQDAVLRRRCLALRYDAGGRGAMTERTVEPLGIVYYSGRWHLIAFCRLRRDFRDFRLDRVESWKVLPEEFAGHTHFSVEQFLEAQIHNCELIPVTLVVAPGSIERLRAELVSTPTREVPLEDGRIRIEILAFSLEWTGRWLLSFGADVEVERPEELGDILRDSALAIIEKYPLAVT